MKIVGTRYIAAKPWFGNVDAPTTKPVYNFEPLEAVMREWMKATPATTENTDEHS